jgi:hypothetical protein
MDTSPELEAYFELCKAIYLRHVAEGTWPWPVDSTVSESMLDSDDNPPNL